MSKILVAEDDPSTARLLKAALEPGGYSVDVIPDGNRALEAFDKERYDPLVTDVMMPGLDGFRLTETLRSCG